MNLYTLRSADGEWRITKFDEDLNQESSYIVSSDECECPQWQGRQRQCRHMKMLPMMLERADSAWFFCFEDAQWYDPTGEATTVLPEGITVVGLTDPAILHDTIAEAVGEPLLRNIGSSIGSSTTFPPATLKRRF